MLPIGNIKMTSNKNFGFFVTCIFLLASLYFFISKTDNFYIIFLVLSFFCLFIAILFPSLFKHLNYLWHLLGIFLGKIFSPIIMGIIFYLLISPLAIFLRLIRRDELSLKKSESSYWKPKQQKNTDFTKQY